MKLPFRKSLAGRLLLIIGFATVLPLLALTSLVMIEAYRVISERTFTTIEQTSRQQAASLSAKLREKLGMMKAWASAVPLLDDATVAKRLLALDRDLKEAWVRREARPPAEEPAHRRALYEAVRQDQIEILSAPDFSRNEASLGFPVFEEGRFSGMVAVSFSLEYFQQVLADVHFLETGYALLVSHEGFRIAHPDPRLIGVRIGNDVSLEMAAEILSQVKADKEFWFEKIALLTGKWSRQYYQPVVVGRAANPWFFVAVVPTEEASHALNDLYRVVILGVFGTLLLVAGSTFWATRSVVRPLRAMAATAEAVAAGQRETRILKNSQDEVGVLADAFNRMTDQLVQSLHEQDQIVQQRTKSLQQSLFELEQAQVKIVDSEKLAVLGQLMATIAHEINTPLGAIRSSASYLQQSASVSAQQLPAFFRSLDETDLAWYHALVERVRGTLSIPDGATRKRKRVLAQRLREGATGEPESLADDIVLLVPPTEDDLLIQAVLVGKEGLIRRAAEAVASIQSSAIILEAADRAASTVLALVDYSRSGEMFLDQEIDPAKELETLLTLYYGVIKHGVVVSRDYEPGLLLHGDRDKLNQVWVNLINNALQAMNYHGKLFLQTRRGEQCFEIRVANDGPSIPEELRTRIFQPFFTTKKPGEGTGLGLDICRRIVEAHKGSLTLSEEGGLTIFTVRIPL